MKKLFTIGAALMINMSLFAADIFNYVPLTGNIKSFTKTEYTISSKFGSFFKTPGTKEIHNLNNLLKEVEIISLSSTDKIVAKTINSFDVYGNITESYSYDADSVLTGKTVNTYKNGLKIDSSDYDADGELTGKIIYAYTDGKLTDESVYFSDGSLAAKTIFKYNEAGKFDVVCEYFGDGALNKSKTYFYKDNGSIDSISYYNKSEDETTQDVFRYAANGQISEISTYNNDKQLTKRLIIKYDNLGNVAKLTEYTVAEKFGAIQNEYSGLTEYIYQ